MTFSIHFQRNVAAFYRISRACLTFGNVNRLSCKCDLRYSIQTPNIILWISKMSSLLTCLIVVDFTSLLWHTSTFRLWQKNRVFFLLLKGYKFYCGAKAILKFGIKSSFRKQTQEKKYLVRKRYFSFLII